MWTYANLSNYAIVVGLSLVFSEIAARMVRGFYKKSWPWELCLSLLVSVLTYCTFLPLWMGFDTAAALVCLFVIVLIFRIFMGRRYSL